MVGDLGRAVVGDVADRHAARAPALEVEIVVADALAHDDAAALEGVEVDAERQRRGAVDHRVGEPARLGRSAAALASRAGAMDVEGHVRPEGLVERAVAVRRC